MKLTEKTAQIYDYLKNNGGRVSVDELASALGRTTRSISGSLLSFCDKYHLATREKVAGEGEDAKPITYVILADNAEEILSTPDKDAE